MVLLLLQYYHSHNIEWDWRLSSLWVFIFISKIPGGRSANPVHDKREHNTWCLIFHRVRTRRVFLPRGKSVQEEIVSVYPGPELLTLYICHAIRKLFVFPSKIIDPWQEPGTRNPDCWLGIAWGGERASLSSPSHANIIRGFRRACQRLWNDLHQDIRIFTCLTDFSKYRPPSTQIQKKISLAQKEILCCPYNSSWKRTVERRKLTPQMLFTLNHIT